MRFGKDQVNIRQGIARRLLQVLQDAANERQAHRVWLYATPDGQTL